MRLVPTLFLIALAAGAWNYVSTRPISHAQGAIAPAAPVQVERTGLPSFRMGNYDILSAAEFSLEARVLATETYRRGREAELSPIDLALGWGPMSDNAVLDRLKISQGNRFYFYRWSDRPPIPLSEIVEHSANMHMIPATDEIKHRLDKAGGPGRRAARLSGARAVAGWLALEQFHDPPRHGQRRLRSGVGKRRHCSLNRRVTFCKRSP